MPKKTNWVQNPSKTQLIISLTAYLISLTTMVAAMTDFFRKPIDLKINIVLLLLNVGATVSIIKVVRNYYKNLNNKL